MQSTNPVITNPIPSSTKIYIFYLYSKVKPWLSCSVGEAREGGIDDGWMCLSYTSAIIFAVHLCVIYIKVLSPAQLEDRIEQPKGIYRDIYTHILNNEFSLVQKQIFNSNNFLFIVCAWVS